MAPKKKKDPGFETALQAEAKRLGSALSMFGPGGMSYSVPGQDPSISAMMPSLTPAGGQFLGGQGMGMPAPGTPLLGGGPLAPAGAVQGTGDPATGAYREQSGRGDPAASAPGMPPLPPLPMRTGGGRTTTTTGISEKRVSPIDPGLVAESVKATTQVGEAQLRASQIAASEARAKYKAWQEGQPKREQERAAAATKVATARKRQAKWEEGYLKTWRDAEKDKYVNLYSEKHPEHKRAVLQAVLGGAPVYNQATGNWERNPKGPIQQFEALQNRDIEMQKLEMGRKGKRRGEQANILEYLTKKLGSAEKAEATIRIRQTEEWADIAKGIEMKGQAPQIKLAGMISYQQAMQKVAKMKMDIAREERTITTTKEAVSKRAGGAGVGVRRGAKTRIPVKQMAKLAASSEMASREDRYVKDLLKWGGKGAGGITGAVAGKVAGAWPSTEAKRLKGARGMIVSQAVKALSGVAARPDEIKRIDPNYPSFGDNPAMVHRKYHNQLEQRRSTLMGVLQSYPDDPKAPLFKAEIRRITQKMQSVARQAGR